MLTLPKTSDHTFREVRPSVLVHRQLLSLQASDPPEFGLYVPGGVSPRLEEGKYMKKKEEKKKAITQNTVNT